MRAVSPACVQIGDLTDAAPNNHFCACPFGRVSISATRRVDRAGSCPIIRAWIVSPAGVKIIKASSAAPDDCFTTRPNCCVIVSRRGGVGAVGGCPSVCVRIVCATGVQTALADKIPAPHHHFIACPHRRVQLSAHGRVAVSCSCPAIRAWIVSPARVHIV